MLKKLFGFDPSVTTPRTFFTTSTDVTARPIIASSGLPEVISPNDTSVESLLLMIPAFCRPMKAMKRPIPAPMAFLSEAGMAFTMASRRFVSVRITKMIPSMNTAVRANCHG